MTTTTQAPHRPAVPCDQALHVAHADAERAYHDLTPYRILIALEADGWHIDYEMKDRGRNGGGPHYIIDASTAAIISKRYEQ